MKETTMTIYLWAIIAIVLIVAILSGCSSRPVVAPSTAAVQSHIETARSAVATAQTANTKARTNVERIDAKTMVIDRYWDTAK